MSFLSSLQHLIKQNRRQPVFIFSAILLLLAGLFILWTQPFIQERLFERLCHEIIRDELCDDRLSLHYCLANPGEYDLYSEDSHLPVFDQDKYEHSQDYASHTLRQLHRIHQPALNSKQQETYQLLENALYQDIALGDYLYYDDYLSPASGLHSELLILLSEYRFRTKEDIEDYLDLLSEVPDYLNSLLTYESIRIQRGMYRGDASTREVISQCDLMMNPCELDNKSHFLLVTFANRLQALLQQGIITNEELTSYLYENDRLVTTVLAPAYEHLGDQLMLSMYSFPQSIGLCTYPEGKDYYSLLFYLSTGCSLSVSEVKTLLADQFTRDCSALSSLLADYPPELINQYAVLPYPHQQNNWNTSLMLNDLQEKMLTSYPAAPQVEYELKAIDPSMETYLAPAFYLIPPLDDYTHNVIYLNSSNFLLRTDELGTPVTDISSLDLLLSLFTTIAHEGFPGHLYQNVAHFATLPKNPQYSDILRNLFHYSGYTEGYATYAEMLSYSYATDYFTQDMNPQRAQVVSAVIEMYGLDQRMRLCLLSLCDIAIHYDGASYEEILAMLKAYGINDDSAARAIYDYILNAPCNYPTYYVGYLEILRLKEAAKTSWGTDYSELRFHDFLIRKGPADFSTLQNLL